MTGPVGITSVTRPAWKSDDTLRWVPGQGWLNIATDIPGEPLRTYSYYGVRGSKKYPYGKSFTDPYELDGWDIHLNKQHLWIFGSLAVILGVIYLLRK